MKKPKAQPKIGVSGILFLRGKYLLGRRSPADESLPGQWCTPGGGVEFGETLSEALEREFLEETGLTVVASSEISSVQQRITARRHSVMIFSDVVSLHKPEAKALDGFDAVGFFTMPQIRKTYEQGEVTEMTWAAICTSDLGRFW